MNTPADNYSPLRYQISIGIALMISIASLALPTEHAFAANHAAKVIYAFGNVKAESKTGSRDLKRGDQVFSGETVATTRGRAQIKFTDGGFASLQPNTEYQIDDYNFEGKADGNERSFLNLIKGSVRLVTGVIGKANRKNFRIRTAVATIGIRGTQGTLTHNPDTNVTLLRGHGGTWDLESGSFSGPVEEGQFYSCNGTSCTTIAGARQRTEVQRGNGRRSRQQEYEQGQQTDEDGRICDLGGQCGELEVLVQQHGAVAGTAVDSEDGMFADTEFVEDLGVVTVDSKPVALVSGNDHFAVVVTTDIGAVSTAVNSFTDESDAEFVSEANQFITEIPAPLLEQLAEAPATVVDEDFATTADGLVTYGRWANGNLLIASKEFFSGEVFSRIDTLTNFKSFHFIYGNDDLEDVSFLGTGVYTYSGGTMPTAIDGSTIGTAPTSGMLTANFGLGTVDLLLQGIVFDSMTFTISGNFSLDTPTRFSEDTLVASYVMGGLSYSAPASGDGFFTGANGANAPLAAGLAYAVDYSPHPFVGTAAFGLGSVATITPLASIKYGLTYLDSSAGPPMPGSISNGDNQFPMGTPLSSFTTTFGDSFNQSGASIVESMTDPTTGVSLARFSSGYTFSSGGLPPGATLSENFHAIKTDYTTPNQVIASTTGLVSYNLYAATSPTIIYDMGSSTFGPDTGNLTLATFSANFTTGMMDSVVLQGVFPSLDNGTFSLASAGGVPINSGSAALVGTYVDSGSTGSIGCMGTCPLSGGLVNYAFTSASAGGPPVGVISSFNATGSGGNTFEITGTAFSK